MKALAMIVAAVLAIELGANGSLRFAVSAWAQPTANLTASPAESPPPGRPPQESRRVWPWLVAGILVGIGVVIAIVVIAANQDGGHGSGCFPGDRFGDDCASDDDGNVLPIP